MKTFRRIVAALLALTVALVSTALASKGLAGRMVEFRRDAAAYTDCRAGGKTRSVAQKGSWAMCEKVCGKYALLLVNAAGKGVRRWFRTSDLKPYTGNYTWIRVVWARGGTGMSHSEGSSVSEPLPALKDRKLRVTGRTDLRGSSGLEGGSRGVVKKGDRLKMTGRVGLDDRGIGWIEVNYKGKKLWISRYFVKLTPKQLDSALDRWYPTGAY